MIDSRPSFFPAPEPYGPVSCRTCGCRLIEVERAEGPAWRHFPSLHPDQDARGDRPACLNALHGRDGRVIASRQAIGLLIGEDGREPMDEALLPARDVAAA
ncbi:MAG: hypothetical protein H0W00_05315 [Chloroflexi bacterium]|nr:hypothetical protein [Chloroflexota bacterium]MDQ3448662.1 hypothetical protein [Chloroflexota bacterium]